MKPTAAGNSPDILKESKRSSINDSIIIKPAANPIKNTNSFSPGFRKRTTRPPSPVPKPARVLSKIMLATSVVLHPTYFLLFRACSALFYLILLMDKRIEALDWL